MSENSPVATRPRKTRPRCAIDAPCPHEFNARHADSPPLPLDYPEPKMNTTDTPPAPSDAAPVIDLIPASQFERYPTNRIPDPEAVKSMAVSIREVGVIQPLLARPVDDGAGGMRLQVIFGETRWRGCQAIDPNYPVPTRIRHLDDRDAAKIHAIENFQRKDLDEIESAREIQHLLDVGWNFDEVKDHVGRGKDWLYRRLALLKLPEQGQLAIIEGNLTLQTAGKIVGLPEEMRERAIKAVVEPTHAARALPERDALQVIERDFVKPWEAEQAWNEKRKLVEKENPGAKWLPYKEALAACRWDSEYEPADVMPTWQNLSEAARNDEMAVPTWGELAKKHGMEIRIGLDGGGNTRLYVLAEALIDAEKTAHQDNPLDCIFRFPEQSNSHQETDANDRARHFRFANGCGICTGCLFPGRE
jgi:ParB/RepB/Spo0J family partition protein